MYLNDLQKQQNISLTGTPVGSREGSPVRTPVKRMTFFYSPSPKKGKGEGNIPFQSPTDVVNSPMFQVNIGSPVPATQTRVPVGEFLNSLAKSGILSPKSNFGRMSPSTPVLGTGSFATVSSLTPNSVLKTYNLGANGKKSSAASPKVDNSMMLRMLGAFNRCNQVPECARVDAINVSQSGDDWTMEVEQEKCSGLNKADVGPFLECLISLLKRFESEKVYPTDIKKSNFGLNQDGKVVLFDLDFKDVKEGKVCGLISSGEFQFDGNPQFQQLLLVLMDFLCEIDGDRKEAFRALNDQKSLLQGLGLLDSDKSIAETTIEDFRKILTKIGLCEEEIDFLVGVMTPPSSQ